jgi:uncharacterized membrane protein
VLEDEEPRSTEDAEIEVGVVSRDDLNAAQDHTIELGLVMTPVLEDADARRLADELAAVLSERYPGVNWRIDAVRESLVTPPAALPDVVDAARARLLDGDWDLVVYVTELPLRIARRPLLTHSSPTHGAALVSLPALGPLHNRRLVESVADAVGLIAGDTAEHRELNAAGHRRRIHQRLVQLASEIEGAESLEGVVLLHRIVTGNLRLLLGMVRANHPWRLATRLSRAVIGALGVATFAIVSGDVWKIASSLDTLRLAAVCVVTLGGGVATLIAVHGLWERAPDRRVKEQATLFNIVTLITVAFGIVALYFAVCVLSLAAALLVIEPSLMSRLIGHPSNFADYARLALLAGALATVGSALGGALESDAAVREATYGYREDRG